jgi:arylsulfatase A-like enzyme
MFIQSAALFQHLFVFSLLLFFPLKWVFFLLNALYLALDFLLYREMKMRLELRHFLHLRDFSHLLSSVKAMNFKPLFPWLLVPFLPLLMSPSPTLSALLAICTLLSFLLPPSAQYRFNHPLFLFRRQKASPSFVPTFSHGPKTFSLRIDMSEKPHIVFLFMESFGAKHVGPKTTPQFHRLTQEGIFFPNFYSNGTFTYRAILSGLFGSLGTNSSSGLAPYLKASFRGVPQLLKERGYKTAFHHNGSLAYDMQKQFLEKYFDELVDQNGMEKGSSTSWGVEDEVLMRHSAAWLERQKEPTFLSLFTISNHHPWIVPENYQAPAGPRFLQTLHYSDHALGQFIDRLSEKTIVFILGDHGQPMGEHEGNWYNSRFLYEENVRVPLLILAKGRVEPKIITELGSHIDLMPTLADLLGIQEACLGTSLMRHKEGRRVFLQNPYSEGFLGAREGKWKWIENQTSLEQELYNLEEDPEEKNNLIQSHPEMRAFFRKQKETGGEAPSSHTLNLANSFIRDHELKGGKDLVRAHLENCLLLSDLRPFFKESPNLEEVNLRGISDLSCKSLKELPKKLSILYLSEPVGEEPIRLPASLKVLSLHGKNIAHFDVGNLLYLQIYGAETVSEESLISFLKKSPHLVRLSIYGAKEVTDRTLAILRDYPLEQLWLYGVSNLSDGALSKFNLRSLVVEKELPILSE